MIKKIKNFLQALSISLLLVIGIASPLLAADSVQLYLAPGSQSVTQNATFNVAVRLNTSVPIDYVHAYLRFPADKLTVTSLTNTGSAYNYEIEQEYDNSIGQIRIRRYSYTSPSPSPSGDLLVATITFQAKNVGNAPISFESSSSARNLEQDNNEKLTASHGGSVTINAPPPPVKPAPFPTTPRPTPQPLPTPPTPEPTETPPITPAPLGEGSPTIFRTKIIIVRDNQKPVEGAKVTIDGNSQQTNNDGIVYFELPAGNVTVSVQAGSVTKEFIFTVRSFSEDPGAQSEEQNFTFVIPSSRNWAILLIGGAILLTILVVGFVFWKRRMSGHSSTDSHNSDYHHIANPQNTDNREQKIFVVPPAPHKTQPTPPPIKLPKTQPTPPPKPPTKQVPPSDSPKKQSHDATYLEKLHELRLEPLPHAAEDLPSPDAQPASPILHHGSPHITAPQPPPEPPQSKVSRTLPPDHHVPDWQLEVKKSLSKPAGSDEFEEPKDMFETAEEQFHYDEKFKKGLSSQPEPVQAPEEAPSPQPINPAPTTNQIPTAAPQPPPEPPQSKVSRTLPPDHHVPDWQLEVKKSLSKPAGSDEFEEPKDMFDNAEIQFHYDEKFKKTVPPPEPPTKKQNQDPLP